MTSYKPIHVNEIPKYPEVNRDLSILIDKNIDFASIFNSCIKIDKKLIKELDHSDEKQDLNDHDDMTIEAEMNLEDALNNFDSTFITSSSQYIFVTPRGSISILLLLVTI